MDKQLPMSTSALAPSATMLTKSVVPEDQFPFQTVLSKIAKRKVGNQKTIGSHGLKRNSLTSALCNEYRATYAAIYSSKDQSGKHVPLPAEVYDKICTEVDKFLESMLKTVTPDNVISHKKAFYWHRKKQEVTVREHLVGENIISVQEQIVGINAYISDTQRSMDKINNQTSPLSEQTEKRLKQLESTMADANATLEALRLKKAELAKMATEVNKTAE